MKAVLDSKNAPILPVFDRHIPAPDKGTLECLDPKRAYVLAYPGLSVSYVLKCMDPGDSCLLSNWATPSVDYLQKTQGYRFQRQLQSDGSVRIWRTK